MSLKKSILEDLNLNIFFSTFKKITGKVNKLEKYFLIFWLSGPFFYLVERDPADLWLTLIAISFLIRSYVLKEKR